MTIFSQTDSSDKGHLVFKATSDLATTALAPQISIVDLDFSTERVAGLTLSHGLHQFVVYQPSSRVAHAELAFEGQSRQAGLGLADEVDRQKPRLQRQLGRLKNGARDQRRLMSAGIALKNLVPTGVQDTVCSTTAVRAVKTIGPTCALQRCRAKRFGAKEAEELWHRQAGLKLDAIHSHDASFKIERWVQITPSQAHQVRLAEHCC